MVRQQLGRRQFFTFSSLDVCHYYYSQRLTKRSGMIGLVALLLLLSQALVFYKVTLVHSSSTIEKSLSSWKAPPSRTTPPRILIGIVSNANDHVGKIYRDRHRQLFALWNDTRFCPYKDFRASQHPNCQILYTFVLGAWNSTSEVSPILVDDSRPIELDSIPLLPRYKDANQKDVTLLNIKENMNDGKTPTFLYWAWQQAQTYDSIQYIVKCDSDALLRYAFLLRMMHKELPWNPSRSIVLGAIRQKSIWNETFADETFWEREYYHGMHLYLAGQFYLMSVDLAHAVALQARNDYPPLAYLEGHEDHDAFSMMQVQTPNTPIRWIGMPKHYRFWEHPVKGKYRWDRIWNREVKYKERGEGAKSNYALPPISHRASSSVLIVLGATTKEKRQNYRTKLTNQGPKVCTILSEDETGCAVYYLFVIGGNPNGPSENIDHPETLVLPHGDESDVVTLNIRDNVHEGMGQTVLYYIQQQHSKTGSKLTIDLVVLCQSEWIVNISKWLGLVQVQSSPHDLLIGDIRDKKQPPRDFPVGIDSYFNEYQDYAHLYLGSDCLALSTTLVPKILEEARSNQEARKTYWENNLGHDLTCLAYMSPKTVLQWIPITQSQRFWTAFE